MADGQPIQGGDPIQLSCETVITRRIDSAEQRLAAAIERLAPRLYDPRLLADRVDQVEAAHRVLSGRADDAWTRERHLNERLDRIEARFASFESHVLDTLDRLATRIEAIETDS